MAWELRWQLSDTEDQLLTAVWSAHWFGDAVNVRGTEVIDELKTAVKYASAASAWIRESHIHKVHTLSSYGSRRFDTHSY